MQSCWVEVAPEFWKHLRLVSHRGHNELYDSSDPDMGKSPKLLKSNFYFRLLPNAPNRGQESYDAIKLRKLSFKYIGFLRLVKSFLSLAYAMH
jgi:hypothetical protein